MKQRELLLQKLHKDPNVNNALSCIKDEKERNSAKQLVATFVGRFAEAIQLISDNIVQSTKNSAELLKGEEAKK
jgi:hypothetical protein